MRRGLFNFLMAGISFIFLIQGDFSSVSPCCNKSLRRVRELPSWDVAGLVKLFEAIQPYLSQKGSIEISPRGVIFNGEKILEEELGSLGINQVFVISCPCSPEDGVIKIAAAISGLPDSDTNVVLSASWNKFYTLVRRKSPQAWRAIFLTLLSSDNGIVSKALGQIDVYKEEYREIIKEQPELAKEALDILKYIISNPNLEIKVRKGAVDILSQILFWSIEYPEIRGSIKSSLTSTRDWIYHYAQSATELKEALWEGLNGVYLAALKAGEESLSGQLKAEDLKFTSSPKGKKYAAEILSTIIQRKEYETLLSLLRNNLEYLSTNVQILSAVKSQLLTLPPEVYSSVIATLIESDPQLDQENVIALLELIASDVNKAQDLIHFLIFKYNSLENPPNYYFRDASLLKALNALLYSPTLADVWEDVVDLIKVIPHPFTPFITREPERITMQDTLRNISRILDEDPRFTDPLMNYQRIILHGHRNYAKPTNKNISFMEAILRFWLQGDPDILRAQDVDEDIIQALGDPAIYVKKYQKILQFLFDKLGISDVRKLREVSVEKIKSILKGSDFDPLNKEKCIMEIRLYQKVVEKYMGVVQATVIKSLKTISPEELDLREYPDIYERYLDFVRKVDQAQQSEEIADYISAALSLEDLIYAVKYFCITPGEFSPQVISDVVHKDLIRLEYREPKFDLLNVLYYKLLAAEDVLYSKIREKLPAPQDMNKEGLVPALEFLKVLAQALYDRGYITREELSSVLVLRADTSGLKEEVYNLKSIYNRVLEKFSERIGRIKNVFNWGREEASTQIREWEASKSYLEYFRRMLAFISEYLGSVPVSTSTAEKFSSGAKELFSLHSSLDEVSSRTIGAKGWSLVYTNHQGIDVPEAFFIPKELIENWAGMSSEEKMEILKGIVKEIEKQTGKVYGQNLLLAVRSSPVIPHPGILLTMLNVGMNEVVRDNLARETGDERFAWENYRAWLFTWAVEVKGISPEKLNAVMDEVKAKYGVGTKAQLPVEGIKEVVQKYELLIGELLHEEGEVGNFGLQFPPIDPYQQLYLAMEMAIKSYSSPEAVAYRRKRGIPQDSGMGIIIQEMRFGNYTLPPSSLSGSGTINVYSLGEIRGSFKLLALGTDIMSGLSSTGLAVSSIEAPGTESLEVLYPQAYAQLLKTIRKIYDLYGRSPIQIEFTFEKGKLYILQVRKLFPEEVHPEISRSYADIPRNISPLGRGVIIRGQPLVGMVVTVEDLSDEKKLEELREMVKSDPEIQGLILLTSNVDSRVLFPLVEKPEVVAFLSNVGYEVSHGVSIAQLTATTAVLGIRNMEKDARGWKFTTSGGEEIRVQTGALITINTDGRIYQGKYPIRSSER